MDRKRLLVVLAFIAMFSIAILATFIYNSDKYSVSFETGTSETFLTKYVSKNDKINEPSTPSKEGYVFKEWQLNGEKFNFDSEIDSDTVLTAKWVKEEYVTVSFEVDSSIIDEVKLLKGDVLEELPIPTKEGYEFVGWYYKDVLYDNKEIYDDILLVAKYKSDKINETYKVGDTVVITGPYSSSSNVTKKTYTNNKKAIGWIRVILDIDYDKEYPYVLGNTTGITGFFKASSIEKS